MADILKSTGALPYAMGCPGALPYLLLATALLAGCLDNPSEDQVAEVVLNGHFGCPSTPVGIDCTRTEAGYLFQGRGQPVDVKGVTIVPDKSVVFRDLILNGIPDGFKLDAGGRCRCLFQFQNVTLIGHGGTQGLSVGLLPGGPSPDFAVSLQNLTISGFDVGINMTFVPRLTAESVDIECATTGWSLLHVAEFDLAGIDIRGCSAAGLDLRQTVAKPTISDSRFAESGAGIRVMGWPDPEDQPLRLRNVSLERNGLGIFVQATVLDVADSRFLDNGIPSPWLESTGHPGGGAWAPLAGGSVVASTFQGNLPVGLDSSGSIIEATDNWWGHRLGPSMYPGYASLPQVVQGDAVSAGVNFVPFRESPP